MAGNNIAGKEEVYTENDLILGCPIKIRVTDEHVFLVVGGRDHQWSRVDGTHVGSGASLCDAIPTTRNQPATPTPHEEIN